jgi:outer membrane protein TolC
VITAQALALSNERTALQLQGRQFAASVALIKAVGGGWDTSQLQASAGASPGASGPVASTDK